MKLNSLLILSLLFLISCTVTEKPEFLKVKSIKILSANHKEIIIQSDLLFFNKNDVGGELQASNLKIYVDSIQVATMKSKVFNVPKENEFTLPLQTKLPYDKVFKDNKKNLLGNIMNMIMRKKVLVQIKGEVRYSLGSFHYDYPLDYAENISIQIK